MKNTYVIKEIRDNVDVKPNHPSFGTFDVLAEYNGVVKWVSVHHEEYFPWAIEDSANLQAYIAKKKFKTWEDAVKDLSELDYNWFAQMTRYVEEFYKKDTFLALPQYNLNPFADDFDDFDEDDE